MFYYAVTKYYIKVMWDILTCFYNVRWESEGVRRGWRWQWNWIKWTKWFILYHVFQQFNFRWATFHVCLNSLCVKNTVIDDFASSVSTTSWSHLQGTDMALCKAAIIIIITVTICSYIYTFIHRFISMISVVINQKEVTFLFCFVGFDLCARLCKTNTNNRGQ